MSLSTSKRRVAATWVAIAMGCFYGRTLIADNAPSPAELEAWQKVSALNAAGKVSEALQELQAHPVPDDDAYFYNLGTLELKLGQIGFALAHLEKANRLKPHDPTIQHNLKLARDALGGAIGSNRLDPASTWSEEIADRVSIEEIRGALGLVGSILVLMWLRSYLRTRRLRRTLLHPSAVLASIAFLITVGIYAAERLAADHPPAVVMLRQTVRSGPGEHYIELAEVEPGVKLRVLGPSEQATGGAEIWRQVRYSQDGIGWIRASSLLLL